MKDIRKEQRRCLLHAPYSVQLIRCSKMATSGFLLQSTGLGTDSHHYQHRELVIYGGKQVLFQQYQMTRNCWNKIVLWREPAVRWLFWGQDPRTPSCPLLPRKVSAPPCSKASPCFLSLKEIVPQGQHSFPEASEFVFSSRRE